MREPADRVTGAFYGQWEREEVIINGQQWEEDHYAKNKIGQLTCHTFTEDLDGVELVAEAGLVWVNDSVGMQRESIRGSTVREDGEHGRGL